MTITSSSSSAAPTITIFGSTGQQGGSVVDHLETSSKAYKVVAVTRNTESDEAKALEARGCRVVKAELGNKEELMEAMKGSDYVFGMMLTVFGPNGHAQSFANGKSLIDAALATPTIKKFFWSGNQNITKGSSGELTKVYFFDVLEEVFEYGKEQGVPIVSIQPGSFMENYLGDRAFPKKQPDDSYIFTTSFGIDKPLPLLACKKDFGAFVVGALEKDIPTGAEIYAFSEWMYMKDVAVVWGEVMNKKATSVAVPLDKVAATAGPIFAEAATWMNKYGYYGDKDTKESMTIPTVPLTTLAEWIKSADWSKIMA